MILPTPRLSLTLAVCLSILATFGGTAYAQQSAPAAPAGPEKQPIGSQYSLGDQMLSIDLGAVVPLFYWGGSPGIQPANLSIGGAGSLEWSTFLNNNLAIGLNVGGNFSFTPNLRALFLVAIAPKIEYFFRSFPFEFPVSLAAGVNFARLQDNFKTDPIVRPGFGAYWDYTTSWAFGVNLYYWWIPQIYTSTALADQTRYGNFLTITLSALYHF